MNVTFRDAVVEDVFAIVSLLADDVLGRGREQSDLAVYEAAFQRLDADPGNSQIVGEFEGDVVACYQLTIIPGLSLSATTRAQVEGVRVSSRLRGEGVGAALIADAEARSRAAGASLLQLTMNRGRGDSHRFYEANGFEPSHIGFKKPL